MISRRKTVGQSQDTRDSIIRLTTSINDRDWSVFIFIDRLEFWYLLQIVLTQVTQAIPDNRNQLKFSFGIMNPIPCCLTLTWNWQLTMTNNAGNWIKYWIDEIVKRMKETVLLTLSLSFLTFESSWWSICKTNNDDFPLFYIHSFLHSLMNPISFFTFPGTSFTSTNTIVCRRWMKNYITL